MPIGAKMSSNSPGLTDWLRVKEPAGAMCNDQDLGLPTVLYMSWDQAASAQLNFDFMS